MANGPSGSGDSHRGGRWGRRSFIPKLGKKSSERQSRRMGRERSENGNTFSGSGGTYYTRQLSLLELWLAPCHLFLSLQCRPHSFLSETSHLSQDRHSGWLAVWKHLAQSVSNSRSAKGSAQMLLADSTLLFFSSLSHESLCLESSQEGFIWLMILSSELGTLARW